MESLLDTHFLAILIFGILIIIGISFVLLVRLLHNIHKRFGLIEKELRRINTSDKKK